MEIHLIDGTYELYRHFYALPSRHDSNGDEVGALVGVLASITSMIRQGATHLGMATDHAVQSFRNDMYDGYKDGSDIDPDLWRQFEPLEDAVRALGVVVWPMIDQEADDALAAAAMRAERDPSVDRVLVCSPDKDLSQCVSGDRVVQLDRRQGIVRNADGVREKFGVAPHSIPDYLALVGDSADGFPGVSRWGAKSSAALLSRYAHLEEIPHDESDWDIRVRGAAGLAATLRDQWKDALLFRDLATLRTDADVFENVSELEWRGPKEEFGPTCRQLGAPQLLEQALHLAGC